FREYLSDDNHADRNYKRPPKLRKEERLHRALIQQISREQEKRNKQLRNSKAFTKFQKEWKERTKHVCKPCWELKYCPYGPLVEDFPLPPIERKEAIEHNEFLKKQLAKGAYDEARREFFEHEVGKFKASNYPVKISQTERDMACKIFGHYCPVFFVNEPLTETSEMRRISRRIPREVMLKVVRRDNYTCQKCHRLLTEDELEFHHRIPFSKGGPTDENNIQLYCFNCNRSQGSKVPKDVSSEFY
ncbi:MAG TPA: HNH endonuclease signature motif containing protein, partial [Nitrososphaerales archaeon]|nr:HNH endonuclease signature motif containing protein [Nitrososphaerales archaeon]